MGLGELFYTYFLPAWGSNVFILAGAMVFFVAILFFGRHSLASSLVLGIIFIDGLDRVVNEPLASLYFLGLKVIIFGVIGVGFVSWIRK